MKPLLFSLFIFIPNILFASFSFFFCAKSNLPLNEISDFSYPVGKRLAIRHKMNFTGSNSRWIERKTEMLSLGFQLRRKKPFDIKEARRLIIDCMDEYLTAINQSEKTLGPYVTHFPFSNKDIEIGIFFSDNEGGTVYDPDISVVSAYDGILYYRTNAPEHRYRYKMKYDETYLEAKEKLKIEEESRCLLN